LISGLALTLAMASLQIVWPLIFSHLASVFAWKTCSIVDYGAIADNKTVNTAAFKSAIAACTGGGTVLVPGGSDDWFITAPINLTSNMVLEVQGKMQGVDDPALVPLMKPFPSMGGNQTRDNFPCRFAPLVGAFNQTNITIMGAGTIDGAGEWWWKNGRGLNKERPRLVEMQYIDGLKISGVSLTNSPFWTLHPIYSKNIHIHDIRITADGENTDGIDPDSCQNVLIEDYYYCGGDDAIAVKSGWNWAGIEFGMPSKNITIRRAYSGCRGGFTIGSEMSGGVEDVQFLDSVSTGESGIRISSELGRGGYVRNILFQNISFSWEENKGKTFLLHINQNYKPDNPNKTLSQFTNITLDRLTVTKAPDNFPVGDMTCLNQSICHGINLSSIHLYNSHKPKPLTCNYVLGSQSDVDASIPSSCTQGGGQDVPSASLDASLIV